MRNLFIVLLLLFVSSMAWGTRIDDAIIEDSMTLEYCSANTVPYVDGSLDVECSDITKTELDFLDGVTSLIQTQLDNKIETSAAPSGDIVGTTDTQDLSNKTFVDALTLEELASTPSNPASGDKKFYAKNDGKIYTLSSAGVETEVGAGAGGGGAGTDTNYFDDFEAANTANVATYDDGAAVPVDGTGGTEDFLTVAAETTNPIYGTASFKLSKSASNAQGEGFAIDTNVALDAAANSGRNQTVQFFFNTSANYADGDICVYIYKDNSGLAALNGIDGFGDYGNCLNAVSSGVGSFTGQFNYNASDTEARLILHVATTNATAYDVNIDHIFMGDKAANIVAPIITEWVEYTPSWNGRSTLTFSNDQTWYRRVGDSIQIRGGFQVSGGSGAASSIEFSIPSGITRDTSKLSTDQTSNLVGYAKWFDNAGGTSQLDDSFMGAEITGTNFIRFRRPYDSNDLQGVVLNTSDRFSYFIEFPVAEWSGNSTNVINSTQVSFNNVVFKIAPSKAPNNTIDSSNRRMTFGNDSDIEADEYNIFDRATGTLTAPADGEYEFNIWYEAAPTGTVSKPWCRFYVFNDDDSSQSTYVTNRLESTGTTDTLYKNGTVSISANKGETLGVFSDCSTTMNWGTGLMGSGFSVVIRPDISIVGNAGVPQECFSADSGLDTPATANQYHSMTGNELTLQPGVWEINGVMRASRSGTNEYNDVFAGWYEADGADSASEPQRLGTNFTVKSGAYQFAQLAMTSGTTLNTTDLVMPQVRVENTEPQTIYLVPFFDFTSGNARARAYIEACRVR